MMRICLRLGYHTAHADLLRYPPRNVQYFKSSFVSSSKNKFVSNVKRKLFRAYTKMMNKPHSIYVPVPKNAQLIHATSGVIPTNKFPWVIDLEHVHSFVGFQPGRDLKNVKREIENYLFSEYCRKILPWSNACKKSILNGLDKKLDDKIEVIHPTITAFKVKKKKHDGVNILFVGNNFYEKGARELLHAYNNLKNKFDVNLTVISEHPSEFEKKYPEVKFVRSPIPRKSVYEHYSNSDIFTLPSYHDTYGLVYVEAMNFELPIVATNVFAIPEIVGNAGVLLQTPISYYNQKNLFAWKSWKIFGDHIKSHEFPNFVNTLTNSLSELIEDSSLRKKLGREGHRRVEKGPLSIKIRNEKLRRVYEEAIKN